MNDLGLACVFVFVLCWFAIGIGWFLLGVDRVRAKSAGPTAEAEIKTNIRRRLRTLLTLAAVTAASAIVGTVFGGWQASLHENDSAPSEVTAAAHPDT